MKSRAAVIVFLWPFVALAQDWSSAQQQVIDAMTSCNNGWAQSVAAKDFGVFEKACPQTDDAAYWYMNTETPVVYAADAGPWPGSAAAGNRLSWSAFEPNTVLIEGDTALIYYSIEWAIETPDGNVASFPSRRVTVFARRDGVWRSAGGAVAGIPED